MVSGSPIVCKSATQVSSHWAEELSDVASLTGMIPGDGGSATNRLSCIQRDTAYRVSAYPRNALRLRTEGFPARRASLIRFRTFYMRRRCLYHANGSRARGGADDELYADILFLSLPYTFASFLSHDRADSSSRLDPRKRIQERTEHRALCSLSQISATSQYCTLGAAWRGHHNRETLWGADPQR
jgi:hypothetical protein